MTRSGAGCQYTEFAYNNIPHSSFLIPHFSFATFAFFPVGVIWADAVIAYPFAAEGAIVKMQMRFQIGLLEGGLVFLLPQHLAGFLVLNRGKPAAFKRCGQASPFLAATVAKKAKGE
jgi:hypothetical protein